MHQRQQRWQQRLCGCGSCGVCSGGSCGLAALQLILRDRLGLSEAQAAEELGVMTMAGRYVRHLVIGMQRQWHQDRGLCCGAAAAVAKATATVVAGAAVGAALAVGCARCGFMMWPGMGEGEVRNVVRVLFAYVHLTKKGRNRTGQGSWEKHSTCAACGDEWV